MNLEQRRTKKALTRHMDRTKERQKRDQVRQMTDLIRRWYEYLTLN